MTDRSEAIDLTLKTLPGKPGVYQFFDKEGRVLYIGKAKNLKKRVTSYFTKEHLGGRLNMLVRKIDRIEHIVVGSEFDALLLENTLIKQFQPRYNVMLKDDKTFPWICIKNEPYPRVFSTRNVIRDGSQYFGPYASVRMMNTLLELIRQIYPLRNCSLRLTDRNIREGKFKVCLEYHLGNCKGPCEGYQDQADYDRNLKGLKDLIRGHFSSVLKELKEEMAHHAAAYEFEKAHALKEKISLLERYQSKSTVVNPRISNVDVFSIIEDDDTAYVNFLKVVDGAVIQSHTLEMRRKLEETMQELLTMAIVDLRDKHQSDAPEAIVPFGPDVGLPGIVFTVPRAGDKKQLLNLSERNARTYRMEKMKKVELVDPERHSKRILERMMVDLRLKELPRHIECFDNSNLHGEYPVSAMVCFRNGRPDKKEYRHFNIRAVEGPDDFATMEEVIGRRYSRLLAENKPLPQLIIVDGGKGQLSAAVASLERLNLRGKIAVIGIAKKLEEIYYPGDSLPMHIDKKSESLRLIQRMRDEAHRFGITHHRGRRVKGTLKTVLTGIPGIGTGNADKLLKAFKSAKKAGQATLQELSDVIGPARAQVVYRHFHP
jgi:excinuclease ABC subunit C